MDRDTIKGCGNITPNGSQRSRGVWPRDGTGKNLGQPVSGNGVIHCSVKNGERVQRSKRKKANRKTTLGTALEVWTTALKLVER